MPKREIAGIILGPLVLAAIIWLPAWVFLIVLAAATILATDELLGMARDTGMACGRIVPLVLVAGVVGASWWFGGTGMLVSLIVSTLLLPLLQLGHSERPQGALGGVAVSLFAVVFLGISAACLGWLRLWPAGDAGIRLLLFFLITIWLGDTGAYYVGKNFGRRHMAPRISPKKTWEGLAGCTVATFAAAAIMKLLFVDLDWIHTMALAAILAAFGPVGDLIESQFKRDTGVKDSSSLIPGHGGLLDRTDSLFYAAGPVLGYLVLFDLA